MKRRSNLNFEIAALPMVTREDKQYRFYDKRFIPNHFHISLLTIFIALMLVGTIGCESITTEKQFLNAQWGLKYDPERVGLRSGWFDNDHDRSDWEMTAVPGSWADNDYDGFAWYSTEIQAENIPAGYHLALVFESIDDNAVIWLDGRLFGKQMGYGIKFYFDIGNKLEDGLVHQLVLRIEDTGGPGGINGAVYLEPYQEEVDLLRSEASKHSAPPAPEWAQNAVLYEIFVRQHSESGTFQAVTKDLDRIKALGVDIIWLMPVHPLGQEKAKGSLGSPYSVQDYYAVNPDFGSLADFKNLVEEIHKRDMQLILDFVMNHSAWDNELLTDHPVWYTHNEQGEIVSPNADWSDVADFNYDNQELRQYMLEMLTWWIAETDIDGYRFDVAELVPNDFWSAAKSACQQIKPEVFFLAEGARPELHLNGHDMTYSWNMWDGITQLALGNADPSEVKRSYEMEQYQYPQGALRMRFTENHDKERSQGVIADTDLNLTAWAFVALMQGSPLIYAGQEVGATRKPGLFEKEPVDWAEGDQGLSDKMSRIIKLRKEQLTSSSSFQMIIADNERQIMAYKHGPLLSFFNFSADTFKFSAIGMDSILLGELTLNQDSTLSLLPKNFGVIQ
ncbi:MAG: alpha-amylase family glycosyl hydrolase [Candidatus Marinimicrobia bacterium]|nr:alpha-amylase family glycosyl hydrolase [Candidatus Neomarinimicrobiota bacterium]